MIFSWFLSFCYVFVAHGPSNKISIVNLKQMFMFCEGILKVILLIIAL